MRFYDVIEVVDSFVIERDDELVADATFDSKELFKERLKEYRELYLRSICFDYEYEGSEGESSASYDSNFDKIEIYGTILRKPEPKHYPIECIEVYFDLETSTIDDRDPIRIHAVLDTGSASNLMPLTVYIEKGFSGMVASTEYLQFVDHSRRVAEGELRDLIIRVGGLRYIVDFIVLDLGTARGDKIETLVLLGRPFMAASDMIVDYYKRMLTLFS